MTTPPVLVLTLPTTVALLDDFGVRLWRFPNGHLGVWPPVPRALAGAVEAHKPALLDLVDARAARDGDQTPAWARTPDAEGWLTSPGDTDVRFPPEGGRQLRLKPGAEAMLRARGAAQIAAAEAWFASHTEDEWRACVEGMLSDDIEPWSL